MGSSRRRRARRSEAKNEGGRRRIAVGVWSLFKRSIVGSYLQLSVKHLPAYLDEMSFRFNNRDNPYLFRDTMRRLLDAETLRYSELVAEA